jgi:hypothetical protein
MEKKLNKKIGQVIFGILVVMVTTSAYAACTTHRTCANGSCSDVTICTTMPSLNF